MNSLIQRLMSQATRLTRSGNLQDATRAIQEALQSGKAAPMPAPPTTQRAANDETLVVDVPVRVVETAAVVDGAAGAGDAAETAVRPAARPAVEQWTDGLFAHEHRSVAYKLFVPAKAAGTARPLVLMLHGCTQNPDDFAAGTHMNTLAREEGFLVLYPAQTQHANSSKCWNWFKSQHQQRGRGEPALLAALTRSVAAAEGVDPDRVYVAGLSAGGAMADILGRTYPDVFAAAGVHSGLPSGSATDLMSALGAMKGGHSAGAAGPMVPTIVFHGDADNTVNPRNGANVVAAALAGLPAVETQAEESKGRSPKGRGFTRRVYKDTSGRGDVESWVLHGAGHAWAGGDARGSYTDPTGPDASAEMLRFFLAHTRTNDGTLH